MIRIIILGLILLQISVTCAQPGLINHNGCLQQIGVYHLVQDSIYPFQVEQEKACFFAFHTKNPSPIRESQGAGNSSDTIWYAYYLQKNPTKIYEFPKPWGESWGAACNLKDVSFIDINDDGKREVSVIAGCKSQHKINYSFVFIFIRKNNTYSLNQKIFTNLFGFLDLTIHDVQKYIKSPEYIETLRKKYRK